MRIYFIICLSFQVLLAPAQTQLFGNEKATDLVMKAAHGIYSMNEDSALYYITQTQKLLPDHPVIPMMRGMQILWKHMPVLTEPVFNEFRSRMLETSETASARGEDDVEGIFFEMASRGLLAEYYADRGAYMKAIAEANRAYTLLKRGYDLTEKYPEFLFAAGIYNYFREAYPRDNPFIKPLIWFFMSGDIDLGIAQIKEAAKTSVLSSVEAYMYLAYIYLRYEEQPEKAQHYMETLWKKYPENLYVQSKLLESLNIPGYYQQIPLEIVDSLLISDRLYYKIVGNVFKGIYCEKVLKSDNKAFEYYNTAIGVGSALESYGDHYKSLAYLGAGRILKRANKKSNAASYFKLAMLHAQTGDVMDEAKSQLNQ